MAQTGFTPIQLYSSSTPTNAPSAGNLTNDTKGSELAINIADKNLFFKDSTNAVNTVPIRQSSTSSNGWLSSTDWNTFNSKQAALVSGTNIKTVNGTTLLGSGDLGTITTAYGGTGLTSYTAGDLSYYSSGTTLTKLGIGAANRVLTSTGSAPQWSTSLALTDLTASGILGVGTTSLLGGAKAEIRQNADANYSTTFTTGTTKTQLVLRDLSDVGTYSTPFSTLAFAAGSTGAAWSTISSVRTAAQTSALTFSTSNGSSNPVENMRIYPSGGVSIGNVVDPGAGNLRLSTGKFIRLPSASTNFDLKGNSGANDYLSIDSNGTIRHIFNDVGAAYNTTGTWGTISDARLKDNIVDATAKLDSLMQLRVVNYNLKTDPDIKQIGFVAQEIEQIFPGLVEQGEPTEDGDFYKSVKTSVLIPILVKAMQEQQAQIDELKNQLTQLKGI